ncbi:glycosyltransferase family 2 protein [Brevibacillus sp. SYSU BS000544]|uniref:glycosyltransferase family 2 protein n=1 Tax=Brevibacillus sp. SYSU BS000544 TaxID=3416443 RepID=UPI003CE56E1A
MDLVISLLRSIYEIVSFLVICYVFFTFVFYLLLFLLSTIQLRKLYGLEEKMPYQELLESQFTSPVSILVPAYNEEVGIIPSIRSLLSVNYPAFEIIIINDGSKDRTLEKVIDVFRMKKINKAIRKRIETEEINGVYISDIYPNLFLLDKQNGGKADALNAGINLATYPFFCSLDGDSVLERDAFLKVMKPIIDSDGGVIASGGSIRIANGCLIERGEVIQVGLPKNKLAIMQVIEYMRAFLMGRIALSRHNLLLIISGAFGVFHKETVIQVGGYSRNTVGEDMELVVRLHKYVKDNKKKGSIIYVPDPVCWTEAPEDLATLRKQRSRWHRGLIESLWTHKSMFLNPKYGRVGVVSLPYFVFIEMLGPIIEVLGYLSLLMGYFLGEVYVPFALSLMLFSLLNGSFLSIGAVLLEEWSLRKYPRIMDITLLCFYALTETFWYRPLNTFWRLEGFWQFFSKQGTWGDMRRKGISQ